MYVIDEREDLTEIGGKIKQTASLAAMAQVDSTCFAGRLSTPNHHSRQFRVYFATWLCQFCLLGPLVLLRLLPRLSTNQHRVSCLANATIQL